MRNPFLAASVLVLSTATAACVAHPTTNPVVSSGADTTEARRFFEANIDAIHKRNREAYLQTYLHSPTLARNGPAGLELGYEGWGARRDSTWPDTLVARNLRIVPIKAGIVYGTYCYTVTQNGITTSGVSERIFVKMPDGWKIAVTTAFGLPAGVAAECK